VLKEKAKVLEYQREIDIENLETLIAYNKEIVKYGEKIGELAKGDILHLALRKEEKWVDPQMMIK